MWSTFVVQEEEVRSGNTSAGGHQPSGGLDGFLGSRGKGRKRRHRTQSGSGDGISESQEGKIKLTLFLAITGIMLTVLGVGTEFWVELAPSKSFYNNQTCLVAHYGLWKCCTKTIEVSDVDPKLEVCGPLHLQGESNCTFFKFYTTGENIVLFQKTPEKDLTVASAMFAIISLFLMVMGAICIIMAVSKGVQFFLKPAAVCFILSGVLIFLGLIVFHQSVLSFLASDQSIPLRHQMSWSVTCVGCAGALVVVAGVLFLVLALPYSPWEKCLPKKNSDI
ncbi:calcium channel, voltage-dependent, gamma subunit 6a isoform X1 [Danio rerio]|uniref:Calcium channel, voltage-dependent, gamma subunit 6a n=2 Tax=Danio rerio TaxID=7955 RepID=Q1L8R4_DANRE|nr:calcium channel, voltage-dependent, gamma subunit 6a [Danio rerio]XP_005159462.1 voltage-dependent calcium channel gamma-6 subunit isoform X1 [Danio rerio]XP_009292292.1 voltage-dependent calcium channel gamma-6 subunit isoform X1 [Danio rerio]XP_009292293.1 voltage-dependent calcium channel gamma-6 subunit isoform X1 [Danio rerio]|eukprot:NP_001076560.1 voltage-dependent calcium channel gamma-6 subunit [Danio rerio]